MRFRFITSHHVTLLILLSIAATTLAVYWQVRLFDFINFDDPSYVTHNIYIHSGLSLKSVIWAFTTWHAGYWIPLTWLSFMVDMELFGQWAGGYHLTNVVFHILNTLLLFYCLKRSTGAFWRSAFAAFLFALHPLQVESVTWITERKDVLSTFFYLLTILTYVRFIEVRTFSRYLLVVAFFILGLMSKPMVVTLPCALLLLDYWPLRRFEIKISSRRRAASKEEKKKSRNIISVLPSLIQEKIPLFVLSAVFSALTVVTQKEAGAVQELHRLPFMARISNALVSYVKYIGKFVIPDKLGIVYPHPGSLIPLWQPLAAGVFLVTVTAFVIQMSVRKSGYCLTGWLWYLGTLFPVIGLVQAGVQSMADRFCYVPIIGLCVMVAWGIPDIVARWRYSKKVLVVLSVLVLLILGVRSWFQIGKWKNSYTIFKHTLSVTENNFLVHTALGGFLMQQDYFELAIEQYKISLKICPYQPEVYYSLGMAYSRKGMTNEAEAQCRMVLEDKPEFVLGYIGLGKMLYEQDRFKEAQREFEKALQVDENCTLAHLGLGKIFYSQGKLDEAIDIFKKALKIEPNLYFIRASLGYVLYEKGYHNEAIEELHAASRGCPDDPDLFFNLGKVMKAVGRLDDAIESFRQALILKEEDAEINAALGTVLAMKRRIEEAIEFLEQAVRLDPELAEARYNLGLALELAARYPEAVLHFEKILTLPKAVKYYDLAREAQSRINDRSKE